MKLLSAVNQILKVLKALMDMLEVLFVRMFKTFAQRICRLIVRMTVLGEVLAMRLILLVHVMQVIINQIA